MREGKLVRAILVVLVSLLVLVGCGQPSSPVERQEKDEGAYKPAQQDESAKSRAKCHSRESRKKAGPQPKPKPDRAQESVP